jgi:hypothetical protein
VLEPRLSVAFKLGDRSLSQLLAQLDTPLIVWKLKTCRQQLPPMRDRECDDALHPRLCDRTFTSASE